MARLSIFLITVALIAGIAGCAPVQYNLTTSSTEGGEVTIPGEDTFTYNEGTVVALVAEADEGYRFVNWTGDVSAIADVTASATNITMNDHYSITSNFALDIRLEIRDWYDLDATKDNLFGSYILMNDLDSNTSGYAELASPTANGGKGWEPIGTSIVPFKGIFDGQGHTIMGLFIHRPSESDVGLFSSIAEGGVIKNVKVVDVTVTGDWGVGGLAGYNRGTVSNSSSSGNVTGYGLVGGLAGWNYYGTVSNSYSTGSVSGNERVGGLVGFNWFGDVFNSYSTGSVTSNYYVGGLVGENEDATVSNSYSTGSVTGGEDVGGLVGHNAGEGSVSDSFWDTETSGQATSDGGTGKTTAEMQDITAFSGATWDITAVNPSQTNPAYIWNIVDDETYPFLSWQSI